MNSEKNYITPKGYQRLIDELDHLTKSERPKVVKVVSWAASLGDRSENADYQYGKRRLREIDRRISFLQRRLDNAQVVDPTSFSGSAVKFGATVTVEDEDGRQHTYSIVGVDEIESERLLISWKSPIGRQLLGKEVGDVVSISVPRGERQLEIINVQYVEIYIQEFCCEGDLPDISGGAG